MPTMKFTKDHEFVSVDGDIATIGITAYAAEQLGDVVFVELPEAGRTVKAAEAVAVVESVKAASDVYAPVSGEVIAVNDELPANPQWINEDAQGKAWFFRVRLAAKSDVDGLLDEAAYRKLVQET